jgi:hydroxysqualene dehydroxylase
VSTVHVVGAGLAGLAASLRLAEAGLVVRLYEASPQAGGRCRSYFDQALGCRIDNGNHMLVSGNTAVLDYLRRCDALDTLTGPPTAAYPFIDLATAERWTFKPNRGRIPWWLLSRQRRIPGTTIGDYWRARAIFRASADATVASVLGPGGAIFERLWKPLAVAALNTEVEAAAVSLLRPVLAETFARGGDACRPLVPRVGLSESLVDPTLRRLQSRRVDIKFGTRLRSLVFSGDRATTLEFEFSRIELGTDDAVLLAVTAPVAQRLLPGVAAPTEFRAILNAHYRHDAPAGAPFFIGVIGGTAEWVFRKPEVLSVTVSAADRLIDEPADVLAPLLWRDVARAYDLPQEPLPPWQIVKEKRATFAATSAQLASRPGPKARWSNVFLAGDWTDTGLPATIEGAVRSGFSAALSLIKTLESQSHGRHGGARSLA